MASSEDSMFEAGYFCIQHTSAFYPNYQKTLLLHWFNSPFVNDNDNNAVIFIVKHSSGQKLTIPAFQVAAQKLAKEMLPFPLPFIIRHELNI